LTEKSGSAKRLPTFLSQEYACYDWTRLGLFTGSRISEYGQVKIPPGARYATVPSTHDACISGALPLFSLKVTSRSMIAKLVFSRRRRAFSRMLPILLKKCTFVIDSTRAGITLLFESTVNSHRHRLTLSSPVSIFYAEPASWRS
jgi:hypothetical protein